MKYIFLFLCGIIVGIIVASVYLINKCGYLFENEKYEADKYREYFKLLDIITQVENGQRKLHLDKKGIVFRNVAVYGKGAIGNHLINVLQAENVNVVYVIDKGSVAVNSSIPVVNWDTQLKNVDAIIVTPIMEYNTIRENLKKNNPDINIIEVRELF